ncbi:54S ribosomal protein, mitochondrial [Varicellaria rhodocarpa]|nr:54S ribosomal protein, mitochondrial [Varicellaria rhodocarpa]
MGRFNSYFMKDPLMQCLTPRLTTRSMATLTSLPPSNLLHPAPGLFVHAQGPVAPDVLTTIYRFPSMEPLYFTQYPSNHLHLPLRRDILHRAVIFEGDATRQGTASTKWRSDVHGSGRKIRPQKGGGRARLGDKKSPMLRGGGVAFGPHPRDFSTKLPRKIYDLAWRTALSYRYRRGELIIVADGAEIDMEEPRWIKKIMERNGWGNADGRSLIVTATKRPNLFQAIAGAGEDGRAKTEADVDVKDLLELGRIVIEKGALDGILKDHASDLNRTVPTAVRQ